MSKRCQCLAVTTSRVCKKTFSYIIYNKRYCIIHARQIYSQYAQYIQKIWRAYRNRNIINNIYIKLPDELQRIVIFYIKKNYLIKKHHHDVLCKIISNKICYGSVMTSIINTNNQQLYTKIDDIHKLTNIYNLGIKYNTIIDYQTNELLCKFYFVSRKIAYEYNYYIDGIIDHNIINNINNNIHIVNNLRVALIQFKALNHKKLSCIL
jgi:hypothetical protein